VKSQAHRPERAYSLTRAVTKPRPSHSLQAHLPLVPGNSGSLGNPEEFKPALSPPAPALEPRLLPPKSLPQDTAEQTRATSRYPNGLSRESLTFCFTPASQPPPWTSWGFAQAASPGGRPGQRTTSSLLPLPGSCGLSAAASHCSDAQASSQ